MRHNQWVGVLALSACSGPSSLHLELHSSDTAVSTSRLTSSSPAAGATEDLTTVKSVRVTIQEVDVRVENEKATAEVNGTDAKDDDKAWRVVTTTPRDVDLMTIRDAGGTAALGDLSGVTGDITEVRLKLKTDADAGNGDDLIAGAVTDANGTVCDLIVPHSAASPGVKIEGTFTAGKLAAGAKNRGIVNIRIKDSTKLTTASGCAYRLKPVIELEKVETENEADHEADGGAEDHADGGTH